MPTTLLPLDLLFIARDGTVAGIHANPTPLSTADIAVGHPSRYALEVPAGWAARHGISARGRGQVCGVDSPGRGGPEEALDERLSENGAHAPVARARGHAWLHGGLLRSGEARYACRSLWIFSDSWTMSAPRSRRVWFISRDIIQKP